MKEGFLYRTFSSCRFVMKTAWRICKKRVILEFLHWAFTYVDWLIVSCVLIRVILDMAMKRTSFEKNDAICLGRCGVSSFVGYI